MKKFFLLFALAAILPTMTFAQLKVDSLGNIGIKKTADPTYALDVDGLVNITKPNITGSEKAVNITTDYNNCREWGQIDNQEPRNPKRCYFRIRSRR